MAGSLSVSGANGSFSYTVKNAAQSGVNATLYVEVSYSTVKSFGENLTTIPSPAPTSGTVASPGASLFFRARWSFDQANWSSYAYASTAAVQSGLQSSAASANNVPLNQSNRAYVDSQAAGASANVRVYGAAGPYNGFTSIKGPQEIQRPSATIINVAKSSTQVVSFTGEQYVAKPTLPQVFPDEWSPIGQVSVVGSGAVTLPVINLLVQGGYITGIKSSSTFGSGLTQLPTFVVTDANGHGASIIASGLSGGAITGITITNSGDGNYSANPTVTASGGVFGGSTGGGTATGSNGGRLIPNL